MAQHNIGHFHQHMRERCKKINEEKPTKYRKTLDKLVYIVGMVGPFILIPQIWRVYSTQDASSLSLLTWGIGIIPNFIWVLYGIEHKEKAITILNILWVTAYILMTIGILLY